MRAPKVSGGQRDEADEDIGAGNGRAVKVKSKSRNQETTGHSLVDENVHDITALRLRRRRADYRVSYASCLDSSSLLLQREQTALDRELIVGEREVELRGEPLELRGPSGRNRLDILAKV